MSYRYEETRDVVTMVINEVDTFDGNQKRDFFKDYDIVVICFNLNDPNSVNDT